MIQRPLSPSLQAPDVGSSAAPQPAEEASFDLVGYWRVINKRKWGILSLALTVTFIATLVALAREPIYEAQTTLLVENNRRSFSPIQENATNAYFDSLTFLQTQKNLVQSRAVAAKVVERLKLAEHPLFDPRQERPNRAPLQFDLSEWLPWLTEAALEDDQVQLPEAVIQKQAASALQGSVKASVVKDTDILTISFQSPDPQLAARIANDYAEAYIELGLETRMQAVTKAAAWLSDRLSGVREKVQESEQSLQSYREQQDLVDVKGDTDLSDKEFQDLSQRLAEAKARRAELENLFNQAKRLGSASASDLSVHPAVAKNPLIHQLKASEVEAQREVSELSKRYGEKHPKLVSANADLASVRSSLRAEINTTIEGFAKELRVATSAVTQLQREFDRVKGRVREVNRKEFDLRTLNREVETSRQLYDAFLTRFKETNLGADLESTNARIIDRAEVPGAPVKPNLRLTALMAFFAALLVGIGLALLLEHLDNTLKNGDAVEEKLGLPMLGTLPLIRPKGKETVVPERLFLDEGRSSFAEAIRTIRTGVVLSGLDSPHKVVLVTSTLPGEGKTTVASNLALGLGQLERVLLVDADMRRASIASKFGLPKDGPGLSNLVAEAATDEECIHSIEGGSIDVLPAGVIPPNPQELLSSHRFASLIERLSKRYDRIVVDSAPAQAVSDALVLSSHCNAVVYVVRADATPYPLAQAGVKRLLQVSAPLVGAVLNLQDPEKASRYGRYGSYGRYSYAYDRYYQHDYYGQKNA